MKDQAAETVEKMTEEEVNEKFDKLKDLINSAKPEDNEKLDSLPSNNGVLERNPEGEPEKGNANVVIDPVTGAYQQVDSGVEIPKDMAEMLDLNPDDFLNIPDSVADIDIPEDIIIDNISKLQGVDDEKLAKDIFDLVIHYRKVGKEFRSNIDWYSKLPDKIRAVIDKECMEVNNFSKKAKRTFAELFLDQIISDSGFDSIIIDMQKSMEKAFDTSGITNYILSESKTEFEKNMEKNIEQVKSSDKIPEDKKEELIKKQQDVLQAFHDAYDYGTFIEAIKKGKIRVKPFDIKKYKRWLSEFYYKYEGDTPFIIKDPSTIAPILQRRFKQFTPEQCIAFVIGFIKFTRNMDSHNVVDHTYMSYFIHNIHQLDLVSHHVAEEDFINILSNRVEEALYAINGLNKEESEE